MFQLLSYPLSNNAPVWPGNLPAAQTEAFSSIAKGDTANTTVLHLFSHSGTHLDAPYHFHSTMNKGERAITIDEVPLEWCFNQGVKLDFRHFADGYVATAGDVEAELARIGHGLKPLEIVVVNTAPAPPMAATSMSQGAVEWGGRRPSIYWNVVCG